MAAMGVDDIARGNFLPPIMRILIDDSSGTRDLDVDDDGNDTEVHHFMSFGGPPPPAPEIYSSGMVQTDITAMFSEASSGLLLPQAV